MTTQPSVPNDATMSHSLWADDAKLVEKCLRGEEAAWTALLSKYKNLIFSVPIKWGFSREESADIFQSVCLDLLCELKRLREPRALAGWLIRITYNKCFHQQECSSVDTLQRTNRWKWLLQPQKFQKADCMNWNVTRH